MNENKLRQLCNLWNYQHTESRLTNFLKGKIDGYDNGKVYCLDEAKKDRQRWTEQCKFQKKEVKDPLDQIKEEYLDKLLHPEDIYTRPKKHSYEIDKVPFGHNDPLLKGYHNSAKLNLRPNFVDFKLFLQFDGVKETKNKQHLDYVKTFYEKFGQYLVDESPQFWKILLYDIFAKIDKCQYESDTFLQSELSTLFTNKNAIKYLITFRKEIVDFLKDSDFFNKKIDELDIKDPQDKKGKKDNQKEQMNKWLGNNEEDLDQINFLKMANQQLVQKIPTLRRFDHTQYIQFRLEPLPRIDTHNVNRIVISQIFDEFYRKCFQSEKLNTIQSVVFDHAFNSNENMLVCAPTGAGKTNIATLSILNAIRANGTEVKIVYISPMKALANELVGKFVKKFPHLKTRQSTGDIQLSQKEMASTNILVTTPQKFDVTTRKGSSTMQMIHLIILDEVHLLNDERGWVIESIVARLFRTSQRTQKHVRLVGLSATLPNYFDVADFLKVDHQKGLFHFDATYRPVPLLINFVGVKNPKDATNNMSRRRNIRDIYNEKAYEIAIGHVKNNKQVLVFVHSRRQTVKFCQYIVERSKSLGDSHILKSVGGMGKKYGNIRDKNLKKLMGQSVGFHHAGMVRSDRNDVERMFEHGQIKILLATATLAWGVNLPAYAVIIKGTDIYDPNQTQSRDLGILDVQQMFGRAGRPQYDTTGQATLMSDHSKVNFYMGALTNSSPIDSKFLKHIRESLNAEITSGTVTNEDQAFDWLKYTFLAVRLKKHPQVYGCPRGSSEVQREMNYDEFLRKKVLDVLSELDRMKLIRLDRKSLSINSTEIGRITSHYYIKCETMEHLCNSLNILTNEDDRSTFKKRFDYKSDLQLLNILAHCKQFESITPRPEQIQQLKLLTKYWILDQEPDFIMKRDNTSVNIEEGAQIDTPQKVILLLQGYLRDITYTNFSLMNDTQYVIQNSIRLLRCMLDLCSKKNQAENVKTILQWCKYIENRIYRDDSPLKQFTKFSFSGFNAMRMKKTMDGFLSNPLYQLFAESGVTTQEFLDAEDTSDKMVLMKKRTNNYAINQLNTFCQFVPRVDVEYNVKPIAQTILKIDLKIRPLWRYNPKWHLKSQVFWVLFDNEQELLHSETITIEQEFVVKKRQVLVSFYVRYKGTEQSSYRLTVTSDRWVTDCQSQQILNLESLGIEMDNVPFTELLDLQPLPVTALKNPLFQSLYKFNFFNPIQTQLFFSLYQTDKNILIGAPTGSGKTIMSEFAVLSLLKSNPEKKTVYIAPLKSLVKQRLKDWVPRFKKIKKSVVELSGDFTPDIQSLNKADIIITTPQKWDGITRSKDRQYTKKVGLVIFDEIHLLGQDRGAVLEVIVSRMNKESKIRMVGLSTAMANGNDVAEWFGADTFGFFNFRPSVRPVPIQIHFEGFAQKHYCPRMQTMNKPAYNHIKKFSDGKPVIVFVSSRRQTRLTAKDLIAYSQMQHKTNCQFVKCDQKVINDAIDMIHDDFLKDTVSFGIVMHHAGLDIHDRQICEELFVKNKVQVMIATSTLAWGVNYPARLVIIKGTEYFDAKSHKYVDVQATDLLQMIGRAGRPQFDDKGVAVVYVESSKKNFYRKFLNDPFPIESSLMQQIEDHINAEIARGQINNKQDCIEWITWSFMFRRILKNPNFYGLINSENEVIKTFLNKTAKDIFQKLSADKCIQVYEAENGETYVMPTELGFISSAYYLKHQTMKKFSETMKQNMSYRDLLRLLSDAQQFLQTPLRHNEDIHNKQLSDVAPFKAKHFSSPQDKTFLLLQMHLFNLPYPIRDYINDAKLILDSSSRVIMGLIEIAKEKRYLSTVKICIHIQQGIYQGVGCNIPFIQYQLWKKMDLKYKGLAGVVEAVNKSQKSLDQMMEFIKDKVPDFKRNKGEIVKALKSYPQIRMKIRTAAFDSETNTQKSSALEPGQQAILHVELQKQNKVDNRIMVQKHTKIKDITWWVVVGDEQDNLLSLKKVSIKKKVHLKLQIDVPEDIHKNDVFVMLMADSYNGLDQIQKAKFKLKQ